MCCTVQVLGSWRISFLDSDSRHVSSRTKAGILRRQSPRNDSLPGPNLLPAKAFNVPLPPIHRTRKHGSHFISDKAPCRHAPWPTNHPGFQTIQSTRTDNAGTARGGKGRFPGPCRSLQLIYSLTFSPDLCCLEPVSAPQLGESPAARHHGIYC